MRAPGKSEQETGDRRLEIRNSNLRRGEDIASRLLSMGAATVRLAPRLPKDAVARHVALQWARSATGAGANYEEARAAESRADFVHKVGIAAKEMREAAYWTSLIHQSGWLNDQLADIARETRELAAILGASARTARTNTTRETKSERF